MKIEGGCLCGKVRYSGEAEPIFVGVCHCSNCQKGSGTAFNTVIAVPKAGISTNGKVQTYEGRGDSGKATYRRFCPECGSPVAVEAELMPETVMIPVGTLERGKTSDADLLRQRTALGGPRNRHSALPQNADAGQLKSGSSPSHVG